LTPLTFFSIFLLREICISPLIFCGFQELCLLLLGFLEKRLEMLEMLIVNTLEIVISALLNLDLMCFCLIYNVLLYVLLSSHIAPS